jgi:hypothetical protein
MGVCQSVRGSEGVIHRDSPSELLLLVLHMISTFELLLLLLCQASLVRGMLSSHIPRFTR